MPSELRQGDSEGDELGPELLARAAAAIDAARATIGRSAYVVARRAQSQLERPQAVRRFRDELIQLRTEVEGLRRAIESRGVIEQAKGVLMARSGCSPDQAFQMMAQASQRTNRKVRDIAGEIVSGTQATGVAVPSGETVLGSIKHSGQRAETH